ncbi:uncharacterized protein [Battus philenor]|uniref:uncharacterized protein n=1 Tax=Battus philenor TaxID=42288 RepID=UPI0035CFB620
MAQSWRHYTGPPFDLKSPPKSSKAAKSKAGAKDQPSRFTSDSPQSPDTPVRYEKQPLPVKKPDAEDDSSDYTSGSEFLDSDSEMEIDESKSASRFDEFTLVTGKRKRSLRATLSPTHQDSSKTASPPKKAVRKPSPTATSSNPTDQRSAQVPQPSGNKPPPPVFLHDKQAWKSVHSWLLANEMGKSKAKNTTQGIMVNTLTVDDFRRFTRYLREESISFHTYALPEEKRLRVVIRGLPLKIDVADVIDDLKQAGLPIIDAKRMSSLRTKLPMPLIMATLELSAEGKRIFALKDICSLSGVSFEAPHRRGIVGQCHRCQLYGHSARNCFSRPRCVKCLGDHGTTDCPRPAVTETPPACVLCKSEGHPANYKGCLKAPKKRRTGRRPPRPSKNAVRPPTSAPAAIVSKPTSKLTPPPPPPATSAWAKPLYPRSKPASLPTAPPVAREQPKPAKPATGSPSPAEDLKSLAQYLANIDLDEVSILAAKLRKASGPSERFMCIAEHSALLAALKAEFK